MSTLVLTADAEEGRLRTPGGGRRCSFSSIIICILRRLGRECGSATELYGAQPPRGADANGILPVYFVVRSI